MLIQHFYNLI